ncbi:MAG: hypothetical protein ACE5FP_10925, partial [Gemmatimonadota bacterium]
MKLDWRLALDIYVAGRNRVLSTEQKRQVAGADVDGTARPRPSGATRASVPAFGVPIPETLQYYRNAGTWRDRIDGASSDGAGPAV